MKKVEIEILADGDIRIETTGFAGRECEKAVASVKKMLDGNVVDYKRKPEFNQQAKQEAKRWQG